MTDAAKAFVWQATWQPWGGVQAITGTASLNARFPGQWFQIESGLHYNWHRHYDPTIGRYTQPDPLGFVDGPSVFGYVGGSPTDVVDPDGRFWGLCLTPVGARICWIVAREIGKRCLAKVKEWWENDSGGGTRRRSSDLRKEWEEKNQTTWPTDPDTGGPQQVHHEPPISDRAPGTPDTIENVGPMTREDHIRLHKERGDFSRWGKKRN